MKKSLRVKGLSPDAPFQEMARLILKDRLQRVHRLTKQYLETHQESDLHQLRIAFRRLRYPLECFVDCVPRRLFDAVLDRIDLLHNATNQIRDLDVMLDVLRTRASGVLVPADEPVVNGVAQPESVPEAVKGWTGIADLEEERARRIEALDGALKSVLSSGTMRKFKRSLTAELSEK